jgi:signal transduction histidine kinase
MIQHKLEELRQQLGSLQQIFREGSADIQSRLPGALDRMKRLLEELQAIVVTRPGSERTGSSPSVASNGTPSQVDASHGPEDRVSDAIGCLDAEHEVRLYQERLRSLMADLLLAEEHERRSLALDLHDGLGQTIALARIKLSALRISMRGKLKKPLDEIEELIDQTNRSARAISFELSPPILHDLGLEPAVQWLVENIQERYGIQIVLEDDGQPKPADEKTRIILFRSIRELLINAAKHAGSSRVHVRLQRKEDLLSASVEDDGVGMESDLAAVKGSGLFSIHERLRHVGGSMRIESAPGQGTKIRLSAPLANGKSTKADVAS